MWLARLLYPQAFVQVDMRRETQLFYESFYGDRLGKENIALFLEPPG